MKWEGTVDEGGRIRARALFTADFCENGSSCAAKVNMTVVLPDGSTLETSDSILIEDQSGFDPELVQLKAAVWSGEEDRPESIADFDNLPFEAACMTECQRILLGVKNNNVERAETIIWITGQNNLKLKPSSGVQMRVIEEDKAAGTQTHQIRVVAGDKLKVLALTAQIDGLIDDDARLPLAISHCSQQVGSQSCQYDHHEEDQRTHVATLFLYLIVRSRDYGDAPTNDNNFGVVMGANFPTIRDRKSVV